MMMTGVSIQCGAVHRRTSSQVDLTRLFVDDHRYIRRLLVSALQLYFSLQQETFMIKLHNHVDRR